MSSKVDEHSLSEVLRALADDAARERIFVRDLVEALGDRALAALMLARAGVDSGFRQPLPDILDALPMQVLSATAPYLTTLTQLGCRTLGDIRKLPRGGISRRFDKA